MSKSEKTRLEKIAKNSLYAKGANAATIIYQFNVFKRFMTKGNILELGPAEGLMTDLLVKAEESVTCVDGSEQFCRALTKKHKNIKVINSLFEDYSPTERFSNIILGHVLEHVENPISILTQAKSWLAEDGIIFAAVPNSRSIHRQAAVIMGLIKSEKTLNEMDLHHGHRRVFDPEGFRETFISAGLHIDYFGGYWLKPVSNKQIEETWTKNMLDAFMALGERYPDIAGEIFIVAKNAS